VTTKDITPHVLAEIRHDIAALGDRVTAMQVHFDTDLAGLREEMRRGSAGLREEMRRGFAGTAEQLSSVIALMGVLAKNDDRLEHRIEAIEARGT
jgi:hypothetical protein